MGSRVMHHCIGTRLAKRLRISSEQFLLGGIAPDVNKNMKSSKDLTHFFKVDAEGRQLIDFDSFRAKYTLNIANPFLLGYYYHLQTDRIWNDSIYYPKIKWLPQPDKQAAQAKYYRDFWRLNGRLIDYYELELHPMQVRPIAMEEIDYRFLPEIAEELARDFELCNEAKDEPLELLAFDEVIAVLEDTIEFCVEDARRWM